MVGEDLNSEKKSNVSGVVLVAAPGTGFESLAVLPEFPLSTRTGKAEGPKILMGVEGNRLGVTIVVEPLHTSHGSPQSFVVFFQDAEITEKRRSTTMPASAS